jgi:acid phosphatase
MRVPQQVIDWRSASLARHFTLGVVLALTLAGCSGASLQLSPGGGSTGSGAPSGPLPHFDHFVVVVEENHSYDEIVGSGQAPYINSLAAEAALFTDAHAVAHPSEPNYLALYAGSTFGLASDACPQEYTAPNLSAEALAHGMTFTGYSESMPRAGYTDCTAGNPLNPSYARKHNPWADFADVPSTSNQPFTSFPEDFTQLPTIAFVVPNQQDDMHSGSIAAGDAWLQHQLGAYASWAAGHNSLLILTWDEDDGSATNHILTLFSGAHVRAGRYGETISHYDVLRTIEALDGLPFTGNAARATTIGDVWQS